MRDIPTKLKKTFGAFAFNGDRYRYNDSHPRVMFPAKEAPHLRLQTCSGETFDPSCLPNLMRR